MPLQQTSGNATADAYGVGAAAVVPTYIEDVFSTWLVKPTSDNTTYSVTNGINVSGKGGMVWMKARDAAANNLVYDTVRGASAGANNALITNGTQAQQTANFDYITGLSNGFTVNFATGGGQLTNSGINYVSWTFRKQPKFFDVVTYTGTGANRTVAHNLGSVPGCMIIKATSGAAQDWAVYHQSLGNDTRILLDTTNAAINVGSVQWNSTTPTSSVFSLGTNSTVNGNGVTYVAYLFAHNAGGFGLTGTDNVISCGAFSTDSGGKASVNLGYEPQWVMFKRTDSSTFGDWYMIDNMRGFTNPSGSSWLWANTSDAEQTGINFSPESTGFSINFTGPANWIYIAIRRGPMKVPTDATKVFKPVAFTGTPTTGTFVTTNFPTDLAIGNQRNSSGNHYFVPRLTVGEMYSNGTNVESAGSNYWNFQSNTGFTDLEYGATSNTCVDYGLQRAPSFFDVVCYTGTGVARTVTHNLAAVPELMIVKDRSQIGAWLVYSATIGNTLALRIDTTGGSIGPNSVYWNNTTPTSSVFTVGTSGAVNTSADNYVAYLFATCAGVSKVFSFTGNGTIQTINCGFTGGARFVLLKASSATGGWYVYDTARGMTTLTDPYLLLNSTAAEVATLGSVTTVSTGFAVNEAITTGVNTNGVTYIGLAIA